MFSAAAPFIAGLWMGSTVIWRAVATFVVRIIGLMIGAIIISVVVPVDATATAVVPGHKVMVQTALQAPATAALTAAPIVFMVQATFQAPASAALPLPALCALMGTPPLPAALPAVAEHIVAAVPAPLTVAAAETSAIKFINYFKTSVIMTERGATLQRGHLNLPGPLDHDGCDLPTFPKLLDGKRMEHILHGGAIDHDHPVVFLKQAISRSTWEHI